MPKIIVSRQVLDKHFVATVVGQPITEFLIRKGKEGDSVASSILSIDVRTESGEILNLIYKSMSPVTPYGTVEGLDMDSPEAKFREITEIYSVEIQFYKNIVPVFEEIAKEKLPIPKLYSAEDKDETSAFLVLEDLRPLGFKSGGTFKGLRFPEVTLVMKAIAKFHAQSYLLLQKRADSLFTDEKSLVFVEKHGVTIRKADDSVMHNLFDNMYQRVTDHLRKGGHPLLADKMCKFIGKSHETVLRPWRQTGDKYFPVLNHGDLWVDNILFLYGKSGCPTEVKFIDFQRVQRASIYDDLLYFFFTSTTPEFRKMHLSTCLEIYFESFSSTLEALETPLPDNFSLETLTSSYRDNLDAGFCFFVFAIPFQLSVFLPPPSPATPYESSTGSRFDNFEHPKKPSTLEDFLAGMVDSLMAAFSCSERGLTRLVNVVEEMIAENVL